MIWIIGQLWLTSLLPGSTECCISRTAFFAKRQLQAAIPWVHGISWQLIRTITLPFGAGHGSPGKRFDHYETWGEIFKHTSEQIEERRLHVRLWELLILIMKTILEALDIVIDDLDAAVTKIINQNKMRGVIELLSPEAKIILG